MAKHKHNLNQIFVAWVALVFILQSIQAAPATGPSTRAASRPATQTARRPATGPATAEAQARKLIELTHKATELLTAKRYDEAETVLEDALRLDPKEPINLYNMACLMALTDRRDAAMKFLEFSAECGFLDFKHIAEDTDLTSLHEDARFKTFLAKRDDYFHKDAERKLADMKKSFGEEYLYEIDDADKLIFAAATDRPTLDALKLSLIRQARSQWDQIFANKPEQYIWVVVPRPREFHKLVPFPGVEGIYQHQIRTLTAKGLGFVTQHEFTHALHAADLDPLGQEHPIWLVEGMAVLFEHAEYEKGEGGKEVLTPKDNERIKLLQGLARQNKLMPLSRLLRMSQKDFLGNRVLECYAEAGSVMHYLYDLKVLRKFYDTMKSTYDDDDTGKLALEKTVGKPLDEFEKDWKAWMLTRLPPSSKIGTDGPYLGVEFGEANDGMLIQTVKTNGPAVRAHLHVGDVIIAVDGQDTRDQMAFAPMLAAHKPGDKITLRLRRNHAYLEVPMILGSRNEPSSGGAVGKTSAVVKPTAP